MGAGPRTFFLAERRLNAGRLGYMQMDACLTRPDAAWLDQIPAVSRSLGFLRSP